MSLNNVPSNLPSVEKLLTRINVAEKSQQKDVRISIQEAKELSQDLAIFTTRMARTVQEIHQMLSEIKESSNKIDVKFDGGSFN
jgi:hypothetical protein